ncbi:Hypothetical predicted protein [Paramuricea clavata]|uniref:Uncharacterized protein n=1 Tax=Paramuricea clavata TaxID=317549 RepID=A0A6S7GNV2_PARCT|nr:Hypothetical predicted protein [Paramuricea clavata]
MLTSESYIEESSSSASEVEEVSDYELEVEEFELLSDGASHGHVSSASKKNIASLSAPEPYGNEPIADEEWVQNYVERKEKKKVNVNALQERLDKKIPITGEL